jgi:hypothetical protein
MISKKQIDKLDFEFIEETFDSLNRAYQLYCYKELYLKYQNAHLEEVYLKLEHGELPFYKVNSIKDLETLIKFIYDE